MKYAVNVKRFEMSRLKKLNTPVFWAEGHPGVINRDSWTISVDGLCIRPQIFTWQQIVSMPKTIADARLTSVTRFSVRGRWGGVRVSDILNIVEASDR